MAKERGCAWKAQNAFHSSTAKTTGFIEFQWSAEERRKTIQQSNGVPENLHSQMRVYGPMFRRTGHVRIIIECPESDSFSPLKDRVHLRGLSFAKLQTSCSSLAD
jgi:hypothetical protein